MKAMSSLKSSLPQRSHHVVLAQWLSMAALAIVLGTGQTAQATSSDVLDFGLPASPYSGQNSGQIVASAAIQRPVVKQASGNYQAESPANHKPLYSAPGLDSTHTQSPLVRERQSSHQEWLPAYQTTGKDVASSPPTKVELSFEPPPSPWQTTQQQAQANSHEMPLFQQGLSGYEMAALFAGDYDSLVAKAIGAAEGTRTVDGSRTPAYYGHVDPGNGAWNLGTFSFQHGAASPEDADRRQLERLKNQAEVLQQKATAKGMTLSLEEKLNGLDLANQAPEAALGEQGYIDWLKQAHELGMQGAEAIVWARTRSFIDPATGTWNAPGLGNNVATVFDDQERRSQAISRAIAAHQQSDAPLAVAPAPIIPQPSQPSVPTQTTANSPSRRQDQQVAQSAIQPAIVPNQPAQLEPTATLESNKGDILGSRAFINQPKGISPAQQPSQGGFQGLAPGLSAPEPTAVPSPQAFTEQHQPQSVADLIIFQDL
ncbi:MAG: hypothetical protein NZ772_05195 [Cyanobacteria bacterium]|nr:hypothetical protein [Cyanobacteriota bacterium]MDW8200880.1 hypothetical protein [Cyanobacteriota bacterium SKYGB_h_bin112]